MISFIRLCLLGIAMTISASPAYAEDILNFANSNCSFCKHLKHAKKNHDGCHNDHHDWKNHDSKNIDWKNHDWKDHHGCNKHSKDCKKSCCCCKNEKGKRGRRGPAGPPGPAGLLNQDFFFTNTQDSSTINLNPIIFNGTPTFRGSSITINSPINTTFTLAPGYYLATFIGIIPEGETIGFQLNDDYIISPPTPIPNDDHIAIQVAFAVSGPPDNTLMVIPSTTDSPSLISGTLSIVRLADFP